MGRKVLLQLIVPLLGLCAVFLLMTCLGRETRKRPELLEISVILREEDGVGWSAVRQGMELAAADLGAELRILSPAANNDPEAQAALLAHEVSSGAQAVLLIPADRAHLSEAVAAAADTVPVVTLEADMAEAAACVSADNAALGETLGGQALKGVPAGGRVLLLDSAPGDNGVRERLEAARVLLEAEGRQADICRPEGKETLEAALRDALAAGDVKAVVAFEASALELAAQTAGVTNIPLLYGAGATAAIAAGLEQSRITAIAAQNEFSSGYLAVEAAVRAARGETPPLLEPLPFALIRLENMYQPDNQKLLFPVTR